MKTAIIILGFGTLIYGLLRLPDWLRVRPKRLSDAQFVLLLAGFVAAIIAGLYLAETLTVKLRS